VATTRKPPAKKKQTATKRGRNDPPAHRAELWGAGLLVLALFSALGIWLDVTGALGRILRDATGTLVGLSRVFVPILLAWAGGLLLRGTSGDRRRVGTSLALLLVAACGLLSVARDVTSTSSSTELRRAGGLLGIGVASPISSVAARPGAAIVFLLLALAGILVFTRTSPRQAADSAVVAGGAVWSGARRSARWLETIGSGDGDDGDDLTEHGIGLSTYEEDDQDATTVGSVRVRPGDDVPDPQEESRPIRMSLPEPVPAVDPEQLAIPLGPAAEKGNWKLPPLSLLERGEHHEVDRALVEEQGRALEDALASHGVETRLIGATVGPSITRFELELGAGVKVNRVTSLSKDIAYAMAAADVRILAPIPGRSAIGVEVPNPDRQLVALGDILASEEARRATHPCEVGIGRDISGRAVMANLAEMPHILIAGATGAGKSSCINSLITSILVRATPEQCRLILIDPKRVELGQYNGLPHLLTSVVVNPKKAANALAWAVKEMERRYDLLSEVGVRDVGGYNAMFDRGDLRTEARVEGVDDPGETIYQRLSYIVVVVDELNDLMMVAARDVEDSICRLAQMARAVGIHLVIATQRPSVNVITGVIKANVPARLAFAVSSLADSRVILDQGGAERLIGRGDMLLLGPASSHPRRIQGAWVGEDEVRKIVAHWQKQMPEPAYEQGIAAEPDELQDVPVTGGMLGEDADDEELLWQAMELIVRSQLGSTSMLQRKLRVGFARAGRLMDLLEQKGVVGPSTGSKARDVLMTPEELDELLASR
jgi:S-DNA-T family DNA segregation ATPase FtsK/SpoIIIE